MDDILFVLKIFKLILNTFQTLKNVWQHRLSSVFLS